MIETYKCIKCKNTFDEFENIDRAYKIDGERLCKKCRTILDQLYPWNEAAYGNPIHLAKGAIRKEYQCALCNQSIVKGSRNVMYKVIRGKKLYMHVDCPDLKQLHFDDIVA